MDEPNRCYFPLVLPSDPKIIGVRNGIMQVEICDDAFLTTLRATDPQSDAVPAGRIRCLRVLRGAKMTDFLSFGPHLWKCPFLLHERTQALLAPFNTRFTHTFPVEVPGGAPNVNDYALVRVPLLGAGFIDFSRSTYCTGNDLLNNKQQLRFATPQEFLHSQEWLKWPEHLVLTPAFDRHLDLFNLQGAGLYVSERVKQALEQAQTTGVKFSGMQLPIITC